jgi:hypothetical protein
MIFTVKDGKGNIWWNESLETTIYVLGGVNDKVWGHVGLVFVERDEDSFAEPLD